MCDFSECARCSFLPSASPRILLTQQRDREVVSGLGRPVEELPEELDQEEHDTDADAMLKYRVVDRRGAASEGDMEREDFFELACPMRARARSGSGPERVRVAAKKRGCACGQGTECASADSEYERDQCGNPPALSGVSGLGPTLFLPTPYFPFGEGFITVPY